LKATQIVGDQISSVGTLKGLQHHWQACNALEEALAGCSNEHAVLEELMLRTWFPKQLLAIVREALQLVTQAGSSIGPEEPGLLAAAHVQHT
jgi:hypothetical protein